MKKEKMSLSKKIKSNPWVLATVVLAVLVVVMAFSEFSGANSSATKVDAVGENFVDFINARGGAQIEYVKGEEFNDNLYELTILADGNEVPAHVTKDGKYFVQVVAPLSDELAESAPAAPATEAPAVEVVKSDKPVVELFIMSYCPYGTQSMKGMIPTVRALGDSIDFNLRFVNYAMHGEKEVKENVELYCVQEEQKAKLLDYMECYLSGSSGSDSEIAACRTKVGIDEAKLSSCIEATNTEFNILENLADKSAQYPKFLIDDSLNQQYGVRGSPTLVINGAQVSSGRSSAAYADVICQAFNDAPEECGADFSAENPSAGFGYETTAAAASDVQCA
ncbi:MAG: hypothetical protein PF542_03095 [Nanoarchaeota archaeon]|jgi:protein-disulfide isomerase|nr:hypothetical protein [Nanoarchaeota archaeon]